MTPEEYRAIIARLGLSQVAAGRFLGVDDRTSRRYAGGETLIPNPVAKLLRLAEAIGLEKARTALDSTSERS